MYGSMFKNVQHLGRVYNLLLIYLGKIFSFHFSDKLVSITSFKASPLSLLDFARQKRAAARQADC